MKIKPDEVAAVLVTRGNDDVDLEQVIRTLPFPEMFVWDNTERENLQCFGRFAGIAHTTRPHIYVQDDDLTIDPVKLLFHYQGEGIVANVPTDEEWNFIGGGAFFSRDLPDFTRYTDTYGADADFHRVADVVFAYTHPYKRVWVGYDEFLPWHDAPNRMYQQPDHYDVRRRARDRCIALGGNLG